MSESEFDVPRARKAVDYHRVEMERLYEDSLKLAADDEHYEPLIHRLIAAPVIRRYEARPADNRFETDPDAWKWHDVGPPHMVHYFTGDQAECRAFRTAAAPIGELVVSWSQFPIRGMPFGAEINDNARIKPRTGAYYWMLVVHRLAWLNDPFTDLRALPSLNEQDAFPDGYVVNVPKSFDGSLGARYDIGIPPDCSSSVLRVHAALASVWALKLIDRALAWYPPWFRTNKQELCLGMDKSSNYWVKIGALQKTGDLEIREATAHRGHNKIEVRFRDPDEHAKVWATIQAIRKAAKGLGDDPNDQPRNA